MFCGLKMAAENYDISIGTTKKYDSKCHIFCYNDITLCLICSETVNKNLLESSCYITNHVQSRNHSTNVYSIFKMCFTDKCKRSDLTKSDFYMADLSNEYSCYITEQDKQIFCLICQEVITENIYDNEVMTIEIINHSQNNDHQQKIQENVTWICYLGDDDSYLIFNQSFVYCSICKYRISIIDNDFLQITESHLEKEHPGIVRSEYNDVEPLSRSNYKESEIKRDIIPLTNNERDFNFEKTMECMNKSHIFCFSNITVCLSCVEVITESLSNQPYHIRNHLVGEKHSENVQSIFEFCFSNPKCKSRDMLYLDIVNNSDFHMPHLSNNNTCYVNLKDNLVMCLVCNECICKSVSASDVITYTLKHMSENSHRIKIKDNVTWIFYLNDPYNYIIFDNSFLNCSCCNEYTVNSDDNSALKIVSSHFQDKHLHNKQESISIHENVVPLLKNSVNANSGESINLNCKKHSSDKEAVLQSLKKRQYIIKINEYYLSVENDTYVCTLCQENIESSINDETVLLNHCYSIFHNRPSVENAIAFVSNQQNVDGLDFREHILRQELILSDLTTDTTLMAPAIYITYDSKRFFCLLCKVPIRISNMSLKAHFKTFYHMNELLSVGNEVLMDNQTLSIRNDIDQDKMLVDSETIKPSSMCVKDDLRYSLNYSGNNENLIGVNSRHIGLTIHNDKYICSICKIPVQIIKLKVSYSYRCHINLVHTTELENVFKNTDWTLKTIAKIFSHYPSDLQIHKNFIILENGVVFCTLCNEFLILSGDFETACVELKCHLSETRHKHEFKVIFNHVMKREMSEDELIDLGKLFEEAFILENILESQTVLKNNIQYLVSKYNYYCCSLCETEIKYSSRLHILIINMNMHFSAKPHKGKLKLLSLLTYNGDYKKKTFKFYNSSKELPLINNQNNSLLPLSDNKHELYQQASNSEISQIINQSDCDLMKDTDSNCKHIQQENVQSAVRHYVKSDAEVLLKKLVRRKFVFRINQNYIIEEQNDFFCLVCEEIIQFTETGSLLKSHCYSLNHNNILTQNGANYTSMKNIYGFKGCKSNTEFDYVLNLLSQDILLKSHMLYIGYNLDSFICTLCNVPIGFTTCGKYIRSHFLCSSHSKNTYKLNVPQYSHLDSNCTSEALHDVSSHYPNIILNSEHKENITFSSNTHEFENSESENEGSFEDVDVLIDCPIDINAASCVQNALYFSSNVALDEHESSLNDDRYSHNSNSSILDDTESECTQDYASDENVICPQCNEVIEVLNKDLQFSMQLHMQKHKELLNIDSHNILYYQYQNDYICHVCQKPILILNKDLDLSVNQHFQNEHRNTIGNDITHGTGRQQFMKILSLLPDLYRQYQLITIDGTNVFCKLCNSTIPLDSPHKDLNNHINEPYHINQFKAYREDIKSSDFSISIQRTNEPTVFDEYEAFTTIIEKDKLINDNLCYINKVKGDYICSLCKTTISKANFLHILFIHFNLHFGGKKHMSRKSNHLKNVHRAISKEKKISQVDAKKSGDKDAIDKNNLPDQCNKPNIKVRLISLSNKDVFTKINLRYFEVNDSQINCTVCHELIHGNKLEIEIKSHCLSIEHNNKLNLNAQHLKSAMKKIGVISDEIQVGAKTMALWSEIKKTYPICKLQSLTLLVMAKKDFLQCLICAKVLSSKPQLILRHFYSKKHETNSLILNCDGNVDFLVSNYLKLMNEYNTTASARLKLLKYKQPHLFNDENMITVEDGMYYCKICEKSTPSSNTGKLLINHLKKHNKHPARSIYYANH